MVTHDQDEAMSMADRIVVMNEGEIEQVGTPEEIYSAPATPFVANFIGIMNFLTARCCDTKSVDLMGYKFNRVLPEWADPNKLLTLGIRPQHVIPLAQDKHDNNCIHGKIKKLEFLGAYTRLHIHVEGQIDTLLADVSSEKQGIDFFKENMPINMSLHEEACSIYRHPVQQS